ncbi:flagellar brake protein [Insulibacter thermoxylanivorax]|uniref:flagellar brake protein n=1 Tax=Insulibacter thermoxylanivorax TaxID=2749268 RepID=UPI0019102617|nr:PilZ domain-containing protein [Insulibacter thermoxylanivorax]
MLPAIGQMITLQVISADEREASLTFKSRLADEDEQSLWIEAPFDNQGQLKQLYKGNALSISYVTSGVKFYFSTHVTAERKENGIILFAIEKPAQDDITKVQRRAFLRVKAQLEVAATLAGNRRLLAVTEDISGGGLSMIADRDIGLRAGDPLECWVLLPFRNGKIEHIPLKGTVVRSENRDQGPFITIKYTQISEADRQKIVQYCFDRQLELRKT